ncbi:anti-sigma factor [Marinobacterium arenosum]|uniref:anti-sigma factor n=1 Tax=Marinobacterium arenosum TaxID=2862496 RepID=UPI001C96D6E6|nr:hypothetical protein [Marinobacterium arenosum]MBY4677642.1 hypothetical protein [Marinobacterium arenosum]
MPGNLRYRQPHVREHLASHYVLGTLSERVRRRCERLMRQDPELEALVYAWQDRMNQINDELAPVKAPERVWRNIQTQLDSNRAATPRKTGFWARLSVWRLATALLLVVSLGLLLKPTPTSVQAVNYMAMMQPVSAQAEPTMIITAYKGDAPGRSHLHIQWNERLDRQELAGLNLWAIDRDSGEITALGALAQAQSTRLLSKPEWLAIKNSRELLVTRGSSPDGPVLFRGPCLQLSPWEDRATPG